MSFTKPIPQPGSPFQIADCYVGTDFIFGDPKLVSEENKLQLSADLAKPGPREFKILGLRFEFGLPQHTADIVVLTGASEQPHDIMAAPAGLDPSGYLPRVPGYGAGMCGVDFATSLDRQSAWFDSVSDVIACPGKQAPVPETGAVWLTALELLPGHTDAVFLLTAKGQSKVAWQLDSGMIQSGSDDGFGRIVAPLRTARGFTYSLRYGSDTHHLSQQVCFHSFKR